MDEFSLFFAVWLLTVFVCFVIFVIAWAVSSGNPWVLLILVLFAPLFFLSARMAVRDIFAKKKDAQE